LAGLDFLADYKLAMRGEMVFFQGGVIDYLRHHPEQLPNIGGPGEDGEVGSFAAFEVLSLCHLIPSGWFYQNQLRCARLMVQYFLPAADLNRRTISPSFIRNAEVELEVVRKHPRPNTFLEALLLPGLGPPARKCAIGQSSADMARVAIALERYRLAHGEYPTSLDVLTPQFIAELPHDAIGGQPLKYRRTEDGQVVLYSVGWNETDDGGEVGLNESGKSLDNTKGDWVWRYPAK